MNNQKQSIYADEKQLELHNHFARDSFLGNPTNVDHCLHWLTFFRRNFHRCATDYLGIKLHFYQTIMMYLMGIYEFIVVIASRASAKSWVIAFFACIKCVLFPNSMVVLASATKGQSKLLVSEKIEKELMRDSPVLRREIVKIKDNQNEVIVYFRNHSTITVVPASDNGRGYRSTVLVREEFRQIKKEIDDSVLSPFQIVRQVPYMKDPFYESNHDLIEEPVDIYISSSWLDNGHWMWKIVDNAFNDMVNGKPSCLMAFDESIAIQHKIKTMKYFQSERKKQDPITWMLEFLNLRVKENRNSFFTYSMLQQNQKPMQPFYPRTLIDFKLGKKNPYDIPKQTNEIRIISCDMAFVENKKNDNSIYSCMRGIPESIIYDKGESEIKIDKGYRRIVSYMESVQGGDITKQALRIRQLYEDFGADYIVLDTRNGGVTVYDLLANIMYDEERSKEYSPLTCMNDDNYKNRIRIDGALPVIYVVNASQNLNSDIALDFRRILTEKRIDLPVTLETARETILPKIKEYEMAEDGDTQFFYESPFLETQALISETAGLLYEKKPQTGAIVISEQGTNRKDRYTSVSYGSMFFTQLEKDLIAQNEEHEYKTFIN